MVDTETAWEIVVQACVASGHEQVEHPYQRVYDYNQGFTVADGGPAMWDGGVRLKFMSSTCRCGARLYLDQVELKEVKRVGMVAKVSAGAGVQEDDPTVDHEIYADEGE